VEQWLITIGNLGIGGGLAFFFAWYLVRAIIPSLTRENGQQRQAFLAELKEQRREFIGALRELKESGEQSAKGVSRELLDLGTAIQRTNELIVQFNRGREVGGG
jgi:hypothetical protein